MSSPFAPQDNYRFLLGKSSRRAHTQSRASASLALRVRTRGIELLAAGQESAAVVDPHVVAVSCELLALLRALLDADLQLVHGLRAARLDCSLFLASAEEGGAGNKEKRHEKEAEREARHARHGDSAGVSWIGVPTGVRRRGVSSGLRHVAAARTVVLAPLSRQVCNTATRAGSLDSRCPHDLALVVRLD